MVVRVIKNVFKVVKIGGIRYPESGLTSLETCYNQHLKNYSYYFSDNRHLSSILSNFSLIDLTILILTIDMFQLEEDNLGCVT